MKIAYILIMIGAMGTAHAQEQLNNDYENSIENTIPGCVGTECNSSPLLLDNHGTVNSNVVTITSDALGQIRDACRSK